MVVLDDRAESLVADLPVYAQDDPTIRAFIRAISLELERIDDYLTEVRTQLMPLEASGEFLTRWEEFLDLPVQPDGVTENKRHDVVRAAVARRNAGAGKGWSDLLSAILFPETFRHAENSDSNQDYAPYELALIDVTVQLRATAAVDGNLTGLPSTGATLPADSTAGFALSGTIFIDNQPVTFADKTSTSFLGVDGLPSSLSDGTRIIQKADYRAGIFRDTALRINPAHLEISEIEIAGADTFRTGISRVGDEI